MMDEVWIEARNLEEQELVTFEIYPRLVQIERRLAPVTAYVEALSREPKFREEAQRLARRASEWISEEDWPVVWFGDVEPFLPYDLREALELRRQMVTHVSEGFVRYALGLKKLARDWGLGGSLLAVRRAYELVESICGGRGGVDVPGGDWVVEPGEIRLPGMRFVFNTVDQSWGYVWRTMQAKMREIARQEHEKLEAKRPGRGPTRSCRNARLYAMHKAGMGPREI